MNRYPLWKYVIVLIALLAGALYALPNIFGETPAVQVSSNRATLKIGEEDVPRIEAILDAAKIERNGVAIVDATGIKLRLRDDDAQTRAREALEKALNPDSQNPDYVVALTRLPNTPAWLAWLGGKPMYLGLDLRGGVHFLFQVDMPGAELKRLDALSGDLRTLLRSKEVRHGGIRRDGQRLLITARTAEIAGRARELVNASYPELLVAEEPAAEGKEGILLAASLRPESLASLREDAIRQNINTLRNRVNELGVAEPIIVQQGADRIVVQLPGVQDPAEAKKILGRTATLEVRLVDDSPQAQEAALAGRAPFDGELYRDRDLTPIIVKKQVILTGERLTDAQPGFDSRDGKPAVHLTFDSSGARIFYDITTENVNRRMAILLFEKGRGEVVTAPVINEPIPGGRVQISGSMSTQEASEIALLLRSGALAAPMEIVEEMTIGPSMGKENIEKGYRSTLWGFVVIVVFMTLYYRMFGLISSIALATNLLFLVAILSSLQATLTLPGIAAIALTLGMAIDANVLINERIREELRAGMPPQSAIAAGYERAFGTILDSNITTLIAGLALLIFGSGPVRGFAVVHCIGIMTSIFSAVVVSRAIVNLSYGRQKKLVEIAIGQIWKPEAERESAATRKE
ncbi:MAG: protein translocase subunit SecD [Zoogloeaceae bacterium]|jgi:preprotein translocase subunit SecD|nr:protein translocase subunit SecD [Zoogloeaceae bacterium]